MPSTDTERAAASSPRVAKPASLGDVARKITSRTTDFLAICIVLVASLTLGSQIVTWWQAPPPPVIPAADPLLAAPGWEDNLQPVELEFGDLPLALTRQIVMGDREAAVEALVRHCHSVAERSPPPEQDADEAEIRLLQRLAELTPVVEEAGAWQVFVVDERFPLVAAVQMSDHGGRRLVCYGLAMPGGERSWTLFLVKGSPARPASPAASFDSPLPPGAARTLSLRDERGGVLVGFSGTGPPAEWIKFYDDGCQARGWSRSEPWSAGNESWAARFARGDGGWVEIRFAQDRRGDLTGLLQVLPKISETVETRQ